MQHIFVSYVFHFGAKLILSMLMKVKDLWYVKEHVIKCHERQC